MKALQIIFLTTHGICIFFWLIIGFLMTWGRADSGREYTCETSMVKILNEGFLGKFYISYSIIIILCFALLGYFFVKKSLIKYRSKNTYTKQSKYILYFKIISIILTASIISIILFNIFLC
jgi:hypothetical protein